MVSGGKESNYCQPAQYSYLRVSNVRRRAFRYDEVRF